VRIHVQSAALLAMICTLLGADASTPPRDLAATLRPLADKYKLPGVVGAILRGDEIVALGSTGVRKIGDRAPFLPTDVIHLGSDTKAMTAILIGQLVDERHLTFDATMRDLFPDLAPRMHAAMAKVTLRNLLTHTAGFPHDLDWWRLDRTHLSLSAQRRLAVEEALSVAPATPIGGYAYSNVSFVVLGAIVESKTGMPWETAIERRIFRPLGMASAGFGPPGAPGRVDQPWGHVLKNGRLTPVQVDNAPVLGPAGRVHCSITDWAKFIAEALRAAQGHPALVSTDTFARLIEPFPSQEYAGGWIVTNRPWAGGLALTHAGSNTTWYCNVWIAPRKDFAVLIATNDGAEPVARAADEGVGLLIAFNQHLTPSEAREAQARGGVSGRAVESRRP
jgi:CubicO group peptidase (beta-lactamase class C family)